MTSKTDTDALNVAVRIVRRDGPFLFHTTPWLDTFPTYATEQAIRAKYREIMAEKRRCDYESFLNYVSPHPTVSLFNG